jgi:CelD/BcsL family acetyltransferase involved in cellulose biosynthesis
VSIFEIDPLNDPRWSNFVSGSPRSSVFHRCEWLRALKSAYGYEPVALSSGSASSPLTNAMLFCRIKSKLTGKRIVSLPFSDHCEPLVESKDEAEHILANVKDSVVHRDWKYVEIRPLSAALWDEFMPVITSRYYLHRLDLRRTEEQLFKSFHKDCVQRKLRRAERESLRYEEGTSETLLDQFYKLLLLTRRKHRIPPQPLKWFRSLISSFGTDLKIRVALKDETPIASILTLPHMRTMTYKYGCSNPEFNNLGGTAFLFWRTIVDARAEGFEEFDLGRSEMDNAGLVSFKDHWGAERSILNYRRFPVKSVAPEERKWVGWVVKHIIAAAPDASLIKLGNLLYRHIG